MVQIVELSRERRALHVDVDPVDEPDPFLRRGEQAPVPLDVTAAHQRLDDLRAGGGSAEADYFLSILRRGYSQFEERAGRRTAG